MPIREGVGDSSMTRGTDEGLMRGTQLREGESAAQKEEVVHVVTSSDHATKTALAVCFPVPPVFSHCCPLLRPTLVFPLTSLLIFITMSTAWDNARRHARALETALNAKLATYSKLAATIPKGSSSMAGSSTDPVGLEEEGFGGYKLVEEEVEELLGKVSSPAYRPC